MAKKKRKGLGKALSALSKDKMMREPAKSKGEPRLKLKSMEGGQNACNFS